MIDWNDLRFALAVARGGSLSAAGRALAVHQTTVGRRLLALEEALGVPLFLRTPAGLLPTADGRQILASIEGLAGSLTRFEQSVGGDRGARGIVRIALTETAARQLLEATLPALLESHPDLAIELLPANTVVDLSAGDADFAVRLTKPDPGLVARRLGFVRYGLYGARPSTRSRGSSPRRGGRGDDASRGPRPLRDGLEGERVVLPSRELARGPEAMWLAEHASRAQPVLHASSMWTLAVAVAAGVGLCVLPTNLAHMHADIELLRPLPEIAPRPVWLAMHPDLRRVARVRAVADAVGVALAERLARGADGRPAPAAAARRGG